MGKNKDLFRCSNIYDFMWSTFLRILTRLPCHRFGMPQTDQFPQLVGIFMQPDISTLYETLYESDHEYSEVPRPRFLSTCDEENELKFEEKKMVDCLDTCLSFLPKKLVVIMASSNGFLLCCTDIQNYRQFIVCNPVTKEWRKLPKLRKPYSNVAMAFVCKGDPTCMKEVKYQVVRSGVPNPRELTAELNIETFSSETWEWRESCLVCRSPFYLSVAYLPAIALGELLCWVERMGRLVVYNPTKPSVELMDLPGNFHNFLTYHLGVSEGKLQYAGLGGFGYMEVWVLEDLEKQEWIMKHKVKVCDTCSSIRAFHPADGKQILLRSPTCPFWFNLETGKSNGYNTDHKMYMYHYFLYDWPTH